MVHVWQGSTNAYSRIFVHDLRSQNNSTRKGLGSLLFYLLLEEGSTVNSKQVAQGFSQSCLENLQRFIIFDDLKEGTSKPFKTTQEVLASKFCAPLHSLWHRSIILSHWRCFHLIFSLLAQKAQNTSAVLKFPGVTSIIGSNSGSM